jgi:hypothetical protein
MGHDGQFHCNEHWCQHKGFQVVLRCLACRWCEDQHTLCLFDCYICVIG